MDGKINYLIELFKLNFIENKAWCGLALFAIAFMILIGAFRDWDWIFKPTNLTYRWDKLDGIINSFGRKTGRVLAALGSLFIMAFAVAWIVYCFYKTPFRW